jgi:hypothetical protein
VRDGYGTVLIAGFVRRMAARGVRVIGGLPTGFADLALPPATIAAIRAVYLDNGGMFLELPNRSRYPRIDFFDTPEHLNEPCQIRHSQAVAAALAAMLDRPLRMVAPPWPDCPALPAYPPAVEYPPALAYDAPNIGGTRMGARQ